MAKVARFQMPDGRIARFSVPDDATPEQAQVIMQDYIARNPKTFTPQQPTDQEPESTGVFSSLAQGAYEAIRGLGQTAQTVAGGTPEAAEKKRQTIGERGFMEDASIEHPIDTLYNWAQKAAYGLGKSAPELVGAEVLGATGAEVGAVGGGPGAIAGGVAGAGLGAGAMNIAKNLGPFYAEELKNNPDNPDAAFDAAISKAEKEGAIAGVSFGAFKFAPFKSAVKNILTQAFAVQPAVSAGATAVENVAEGRDVAENITPTSYAETALGAIVPAGVIHGLGRTYGAIKGAIKPEKPESPAYRERVESVTKEGYSIEDAEAIVTNAEKMQRDLSLSAEDALDAARKQWESENEKPVDETDFEQDHEGASGEPVDTGTGAGISVPSGETTAETAVGKPEELRTDGLVPSDTSAGLPRGGERGVETPLAEEPVDRTELGLKPIPYDTAALDNNNQIVRSSGANDVIDLAGRKIVLVDVNGTQVPFYLSTGKGGKTDVPAGKWYPFFGIGKDGWFNKTAGEQITSYYGSEELRNVATQLDSTIGDIRGDTSIPKVTPTGQHIDAINEGLTPTENGTDATPANLRANIVSVLDRIKTGAPKVEELPVETPVIEVPVVETQADKLKSFAKELLEEPKLETETIPAEIPEVKTPELSDTYQVAAEAVQQRATTDPTGLITPAFIAKVTNIEIPEAKNVLEQLQNEGVVGDKVGVIGYKPITPEIPAAPEIKAPKPPASPKVDMAARKADLLSKIETAFEDDVITEDQYRDFKFAVAKDRGLPNRALKLIGAEELVEPAVAAAPESKVEPKVEAELVTEPKAQRDLTEDEFKNAHALLNRGETLTPELFEALGVDEKQLPTTRVDQNTGKINIEGMSKQETTVALRERLNEARKTLGLSDTAYRNIARFIDSGKELPEGAMDLLGVTKELSPAEARTKYLREMLNKKQREQEARKLADEEGWISGDLGEAGIEKLATAKARYTTNVLQMAAKLLEFGKINRYEHAALVNEVTKETPQRDVLAKALNNFSKRTKTEEPTTLLKDLNVADAAELIAKRLDAKWNKPGLQVQAARGRPPVIEGKAADFEPELERHMQENTPDHVTGEIFGDSNHYPEWATEALKDKPEASIIYSDGDSIAVYRGYINGKSDYGIIERGHRVEDLTAYDYLRTIDKTDPLRRMVKEAIKDHEAQEAANAKDVPDGPFEGKKGQVVKSETMDARYANLLSSLMKHMNIDGLRVFLYHSKDIQGAKRHLYGLYGNYGHLDTIPDGGELGHKIAMGKAINGATLRQGRDFAIMLKPGMSERLTVEVLTHELGHVIEDVAFHTATPEVFTAIQKEYAKWFAKSRKLAPVDVLNQLKLSEEFTAGKLTPKDYVPGELVSDKAYDDYLRSFPEWWADNVARWMNTSAKPVSVIGKFFKSVADQLRKLVQAVTGKPLPPNKLVAAFLEDMQAGRRDYVADFLGQKVEIPKDFDMSGIFSTDYEASKLPPKVMKAAAKVKSANEKIAEAEEKYRVSKDATEQLGAIEEAIKARDPSKIKDAVDIYVDSLKSGAQLKNGLSFLPTSWVIERVEKVLPSMRQASTLLDFMNGAKNKMTRGFSDMSRDISKFVNKNGADTLGKTIALARLLQVRVSSWKADTTLAEAIAHDDEVIAYRDKAAKATDQTAKNTFEAKAKDRESIVAKLYSEWTELGKQEGGQQMYTRLMEFFKNAHYTIHSLLTKDIDNMKRLTAEEKTILKNEANEQFNMLGKSYVDEDGIYRRSSVESYFPWKRFGEYWLRVKPPKGEEGFHVFESAAQLEKFKRSRAAQLGVPHEGSEAAKYFEQGNDLSELRNSIRKNNMSPMLQRMFKVLDKAEGARGIDAAQIKDDLIQMWLLTLPERSVRKQFIHSGDITGMSTDFIRVFNDTSKTYANQIAKLQYGNRIRTQIEAARQAIQPTEKSEENLDPKERARLESYIDVVSRRAEESITPPDQNGIISGMNHLAHFQFLSSPSHALRNMVSVPMRILPRMYSKHGAVNAIATFTKFAKMYDTITLEDANGNLIEPTMRGSKLLKKNPHLEEMLEMGVARDAVSGIGREIIRYDMPSTSKGRRVARSLYDAATFMFNASERLSREMGFLMQVDLSYNKFIREGKSATEAKQLAVDDAVQGIESGIGKFSEFERPDIMRSTGVFGDAARAMFMFKMWSIAQFKFFYTAADKIFRGKELTSAERVEAFKELSGVLGMALTFAGAFGLPGMSSLFSTIDVLDNMFVGDDDPEKKKRRMKNPLLADSSEARFRYQWLPEHFGQVKIPNINGKEVGLDQVIAQGPVSALTGVDIGSKLTYNNLWWRSSGYSPTYVGEVSNFIQNNLGPDISIGLDFVEAADNFAKGDILRGVSNLVPSLGKGFLSAYRLQTEGVLTSKGIPIVKKDDISSTALAMNAIGFSPTAVNDAYNRRTIITGELKRWETDKQNIKDRFLKAVLNHEDLRPIIADVKKFNARYPQPELALTAAQLYGTLNTYQKTYTSSLYGVKMPNIQDWKYNQWYNQGRYK